MMKADRTKKKNGVEIRWLVEGRGWERAHIMQTLIRGYVSYMTHLGPLPCHADT